VSTKNRAWAVYLGASTRENKAKYRRARNDVTTILRRKKRQKEDREHEEMEEFFRANDTQKFYEKVNRSRRGYVPQADSCRDVEGNLITDESEVVERWRQHFDEHLNGDTANGDGVGTDLGVPAADERIPAPDYDEIRREIGRTEKQQSRGQRRTAG